MTNIEALPLQRGKRLVFLRKTSCAASTAKLMLFLDKKPNAKALRENFIKRALQTARQSKQL